MAKYLPLLFVYKEQRYQNISFIEPPTNQEIKIWTKGDFEKINLLSGDVLCVHIKKQQTKYTVNRNEIASAIAGYDIYGDVLLLEKKKDLK